MPQANSWGRGLAAPGTAARCRTWQRVAPGLEGEKLQVRVRLNFFGLLSSFLDHLGTWNWVPQSSQFKRGEALDSTGMCISAWLKRFARLLRV